MTRLLASLLAVVLSGVFIWWQHGKIAALRADNTRLENNAEINARAAARAREAAIVLSAHYTRINAANAALSAEISALRGQEGYNAPLSDFLGTVYDSL